MVSEQRRAYLRRYYLANRERLLTASKARYDADPQAWIRRVTQRDHGVRAFIRQQKEGKSCMHCGFSAPRALDFHHRDPSAKEVTIGVAWQVGWSRKRILAEIAKCDIVCANCHRIMHAEERDEP